MNLPASNLPGGITKMLEFTIAAVVSWFKGHALTEQVSSCSRQGKEGAKSRDAMAVNQKLLNLCRWREKELSDRDVLYQV